ncbi:MAG: hypothetical protein ABIM50_00890 [Novosphingobium sp.]
MREHLILCSVALLTAVLPVAAMADDPHDPAMRTAAARARDHEIIRRMNEEQLAYVGQRDARYAEGWRAYRSRGADREDYERANQRYAQDRSSYERQMAAWRRAVAACRAGDDSACKQ